MDGAVPPPGEGQDPGFEHPEILENQSPWAVGAAYNSAITFLQAYGWFLLLGVVALMYAKSKLQPHFDKMMKKREEQQYLNVDPDHARARQEAMEAARRRFQEMNDVTAARHAEEQKKKEEEKRRARIEDWDRHQKGGGYRSKYKPQEEAPSTTESKPKFKPKTTYRTSDYNPLTGQGGSSTSYRPPRRGGAGGGG